MIQNQSIRTLQLILFFYLLPTGIFAQNNSQNQLVEWTSSVGKMLHSYYSALDVAKKEIIHNTGAKEMPALYAGGPYEGGWAFSFGRIEENGEFIITFGVIVNKQGKIEKFDHFDFRRVASRHHTLAAHALLRIQNDFKAFRNKNELFEANVYRYAVLPFPRENLTAFISPAQVCNDATLVGNDMMYTLSRNDLKIISRIRFIHSLLVYPKVLPEKAVLPALNVPKNPMPSPIDVLISMERNEKLAVNASNGVYLIEPNGTISILDEGDPLREALWQPNQ